MNNLSYITLGIFFSIISLGAVLDDPRNPPLARTGAPGETTCQNPDCHKGGSFVGKVTLTGMPDTVKANEKYSLTITQASNALRAGFEVTSLDGSDNRAGTFSTKDNTTNVATQTGRQYIRQARAVLLTNGNVSWSFDWTAPASLTSGDTIRFYFVSLAGNNNDNESGDNVLINAKTVSFNSSLAISDLKESDVYEFFISHSELTIHPKSDLNSLRISNLNGAEVFQSVNLQSNRIVKLELESGIYILSTEHKSGKNYSRKIFVE